MCVCSVAQSWTIASQPALHVEFSRQEYWSGLPFPSPRDLPDLGIELEPLASPAWEGGFFTTRVTWEAHCGLTKRAHKGGDSQAHIIARHILLKNLQYNHSPGALLFLLMVRVSLKTPQPTATHVLGPEKKTRKSKRQNPIPMVSGCGHTRLLHLEYKLSLSFI